MKANLSGPRIDRLRQYSIREKVMKIHHFNHRRNNEYKTRKQLESVQV